jgi:hypothetical protein
MSASILHSLGSFTRCRKDGAATPWASALPPLLKTLLCQILHKWQGGNCNQILIDLDGKQAYTVSCSLALGRVMARVRGRAAM